MFEYAAVSYQICAYFQNRHLNIGLSQVQNYCLILLKYEVNVFFKGKFGISLCVTP